MIGDEIEISVLSVMGDKVRIGIQAPRSIPVYRREVYVAIQREREDELVAAETDLIVPERRVTSQKVTPPRSPIFAESIRIRMNDQWLLSSSKC